jgi:DNA polymerase III epsilon subunit-like protein
MVDVETDGPIPGDYSMLAIGAVVVEPGLGRTFKAYLRAMTDRFEPEALSVGGFDRDETLSIGGRFRAPAYVMCDLRDWLSGLDCRPVFVADNNGFDWSFVNWYFHHFLGTNPFGFSSQNLGSLYKGLMRDSTASFKHLRRTRHDHDPLNDAIGNAEALLHMVTEMGLKASI